MLKNFTTGLTIWTQLYSNEKINSSCKNCRSISRLDIDNVHGELHDEKNYFNRQQGENHNTSNLEHCCVVANNIFSEASRVFKYLRKTRVDEWLSQLPNLPLHAFNETRI